MTSRPPPGEPPGEPPDEPGMPGMIERLDAGEPPASPEEAQARAPYEQLVQRIRGLDDIAPPAGWEDRAAARWSRGRRRRRLIMAAGATAVAAAAVLVLRPCAAPGVPGLEVAVLAEPGSRPRGDAAIGDRLQARARLERPHTELRIYLGARRIARCPGSAQCQHGASALAIDWRLVEAGTYQIIVLSSDASIPAGDGTLDSDVLAARGAGAQVEIRHLAVSP